MMPGLSIDHIIILGIIALVVVGPKDLPLLLRKLGMWTAKLRGMAQEFRTGFDELARQAELDELRREVDALRRTTNIHDIGRDLQKPLGTLESFAAKPTPRYDTPTPAPTEPQAPGVSGAGADEASAAGDEPPPVRSTAS